MGSELSQEEFLWSPVIRDADKRYIVEHTLGGSREFPGYQASKHLLNCRVIEDDRCAQYIASLDGPSALARAADSSVDCD